MYVCMYQNNSGKDLAFCIMDSKNCSVAFGAHAPEVHTHSQRITYLELSMAVVRVPYLTK